MFTNWSSLYFVLRYSAILIISALYAASTCTSPLPPSFLFTYSLSMSQLLGVAFYTLLASFWYSCQFVLFLQLLLLLSSLLLYVTAKDCPACCYPTDISIVAKVLSWPFSSEKVWSENSTPFHNAACMCQDSLFHLSLLTYLLTPWNTVLDKLTSSLLVKKFPAFSGI